MKSKTIKESPVKLSKIKGGFTIIKLRGTFNDVIERVKPEKNPEKNPEKKDE